jgi:hypothetical protein
MVKGVSAVLPEIPPFAVNWSSRNIMPGSGIVTARLPKLPSEPAVVVQPWPMVAPCQFREM